MKQVLRAIPVLAVLLYSSASHTAITGDVSSGGIFFDNVSTDNGWIIENPTRNGVDFWTFTANANSLLSINITSAIDFGISVYTNAVSDDLGFAFDNDADFTDPISLTTGTYVGGTNGLFGESGSKLLNLQLADAGLYTLTLGGDLGFGRDGPFEYKLGIDIKPVPLPAALPLMLAGLIGFSVLSRRK